MTISRKSEAEDPPFLYDSIVTVIVGPETHRFNVHRGLLCANSDFFKAALNGGFKEKDGIINLPEQTTKTFKFFVQWLYTGKLRGYYYPKTLKPTIEGVKQEVLDELSARHLESLGSLSLGNAKYRAFHLANYRDAPFSDLVALYVLADTLHIHDLKDPIATLIIEVYGLEAPGESHGVDRQYDDVIIDNNHQDDDHNPLQNPLEWASLFWSLEGLPEELESPVSGINMASENLPATSPLCQLLVHCFCDNVVDVVSRTSSLDYHPGFLAAIANEYALRWANAIAEGTNWDKKGEICKFHEHGPDDECAFAKRVVVGRLESCT